MAVRVEFLKSRFKDTEEVNIAKRNERVWVGIRWARVKRK